MTPYYQDDYVTLFHADMRAIPDWYETADVLLTDPPYGMNLSVADPFCGSGSTLVAAKTLGRKAIGVEIEEQWCEIAARRLLPDALPFGDIA